MSDDSYITQARAALLNALGDTEADWVGEEQLLDLYSLLVLVKGEACESEDIHDAWAVARQRFRPGHPDLVRFDQLSSGTQAYDVPFRDAVRVAARSLSQETTT